MHSIYWQEELQSDFELNGLSSCHINQRETWVWQPFSSHDMCPTHDQTSSTSASTLFCDSWVDWFTCWLLQMLGVQLAILKMIYSMKWNLYLAFDQPICFQLIWLAEFVESILWCHKGLELASWYMKHWKAHKILSKINLTWCTFDSCSNHVTWEKKNLVL